MLMLMVGVSVIMMGEGRLVVVVRVGGGNLGIREFGGGGLEIGSWCFDSRWASSCGLFLGGERRGELEMVEEF